MSAWMHALARRLGATSTVLRLVAQSFTPLDTNRVPGDWQHITKVDPENEKKLPVLFPLYLQHTDAISVGGSADVTVENTHQTFELLSLISDVPLFHEPSAAQHVTERTWKLSEFLAIPEVLNGDSKSLVGTLGEGTVYLKEQLVPHQLRRTLPDWITNRWGDKLADFGTSWALSNAVFEAYIIQNLDSAAAREANVSVDNLLSPTEAKQRALAAEKHLGSDVVYVEYSGTFGGQEGLQIVSTVANALTWSRLWYGGGLDSRADTLSVLESGADAVIVGNVFHEIAHEEHELCLRASSELNGDVDLSDITAWLHETIDIPETSAAMYLSTIPTVDDDVETARKYLSRAIHVLLSCEHRACKLESTERIDSFDDIKRRVDETDRTTTLYSKYLKQVLGHDETRLANSVVRTRIARRLNVATETELLAAHVGMDEPAIG